MAKIIDIDGKEREECVTCGRGMWSNGQDASNKCPVCSGNFTKEHYDKIMKGGMDINGEENRTCPDCGRERWKPALIGQGPPYCPVCSGKFTKEQYDRMTKNEEEDK